MDDQLLQQELEALAVSATIKRWNHLFQIPADDAVDRIMEHRNKLTRTRITDDHWDAIRADKEPQGYDVEAYEYELELQKRKANLANLLPVDDDGTEGSVVTYLVELSGALDSVDVLRKAAGLEEAPQTVSGWSVEEKRSLRMCIVGGKEKNATLRWAAEQGGGFEPTILVNPKSM